MSIYDEVTPDAPAGEVLDADTAKLVTQLGLSLGERATQLAADNAGLRAERDLLRREINERNQLITGLRAQIAMQAGSAELVGQAWSALGEAGIGPGPDLTFADAIRTLADTPLDALPAPDVTNPEHNAFIYAWFGQLSDEQLGDPSGRDGCEADCARSAPARTRPPCGLATQHDSPTRVRNCDRPRR